MKARRADTRNILERTRPFLHLFQFNVQLGLGRAHGGAMGLGSRAPSLCSSKGLYWVR